MLTRRHVLASALAAPTILRFGTGTAHAATTLKISHQCPGGTVDKGDFRDRLTRIFAAEVAKRSGGEIAADIYPNSSLIKTNAQFSAMRKGALDISLVPLSYAGGEVPETNIGLMPGLVSTYDQGLRWKNQPVGKALMDFLADKGIIILTWIWQAGAVAAVERTLCGDADRRLRRRPHLLHQPDLVPARGSRQSPDLGRRHVLLVHARTAVDVEIGLRRVAEEPEGHHSGGRHGTGSIRQERRAGRRYRSRQSL